MWGGGDMHVNKWTYEWLLLNKREEERERARERERECVCVYVHMRVSIWSLWLSSFAHYTLRLCYCRLNVLLPICGLSRIAIEDDLFDLVYTLRWVYCCAWVWCQSEQLVPFCTYLGSLRAHIHTHNTHTHTHTHTHNSVFFSFFRLFAWIKGYVCVYVYLTFIAHAFTRITDGNLMLTPGHWLVISAVLISLCRPHCSQVCAKQRVIPIRNMRKRLKAALFLSSSSFHSLF